VLTRGQSGGMRDKSARAMTPALPGSADQHTSAAHLRPTTDHRDGGRVRDRRNGASPHGLKRRTVLTPARGSRSHVRRGRLGDEQRPSPVSPQSRAVSGNRLRFRPSCVDHAGVPLPSLVNEGTRLPEGPCDVPTEGASSVPGDDLPGQTRKSPQSRGLGDRCPVHSSSTRGRSACDTNDVNYPLRVPPICLRPLRSDNTLTSSFGRPHEGCHSQPTRRTAAVSQGGNGNDSRPKTHATSAKVDAPP
jgi:hypothetical protein